MIVFLFQVQLFLKDSWLTSLQTSIKTSLRDIGKGWFNLEEDNWEVYKLSKLSKLMELVRFSMQVIEYFENINITYTHMYLFSTLAKLYTIIFYFFSKKIQFQKFNIKLPFITMEMIFLGAIYKLPND